LSRPRDRVTALLRDGHILRVKKGLYVKNDRKEPFSREILANLIDGPSYLSLEYALAYHCSVSAFSEPSCRHEALKWVKS